MGSHQWDWRAKSPEADKYPKEDLLTSEFPRNSALAAPSPPHPISSLLVGPLVEARGRFSGGSRQNYKGTPGAAKRRESPPVARRAPAREVTRCKGEASRLSLTCRRSFHRAAPKGSETWSRREAPLLAGPSPTARSASPAWASATWDSIPLKPPIYPELSRPRLSPARTCRLLPSQDLWAGPPSDRPSKRTLPEFRISGIRVSLATRAARLASLHHFVGGHL